MDLFRKTLLIIALIISSNIIGQGVSLKWSDPLLLDNKKDGFFRTFLAENEKYVYAKFATLSKKDKFKIVSFDKKTMKRVASAPIFGYDVLLADEKKYKDLSYLKTIIYEKHIYVFFTNYNKQTENKTFLVKSFSPELKPLSKLKEIISVSTEIISDEKSASVLL